MPRKLSSEFVFEGTQNNFDKAVDRACQERTLLDALEFICEWEDRFGTNDTSFRVCLEQVLDKFCPDVLKRYLVFSGSEYESDGWLGCVDSFNTFEEAKIEAEKQISVEFRGLDFADIVDTYTGEHIRLRGDNDE